MSFSNHKTGQAVPYGILSYLGNIHRTFTYIHAIHILDVKISEIARFTEACPSYFAEEWFLCPEKCLTWTEKQIKSAGYNNLAGLAKALEYPETRNEINRTIRIRQMILKESWRRPANVHKLIWRFGTRQLPGIGEVLSIVWATEIARDAFDAYTNGKLGQLPLFHD